MERADLENEWLHLTREALPAVARECGFPVVNDHCFQRIFLDHACGGEWYAHIPDRPAYRHAPGPILARATELARETLDGHTDLVAMNRQSLIWRGKV